MALASFSEALISVLHSSSYNTPVLHIYFDYNPKVLRLNSALAYVYVCTRNSSGLSDAEPAYVMLKFSP